MSFVTKIIPGILLFYLIYCGLLFVMQRQVMFPRYLMGKPPSAPAEIPGVEKIWLNTSFGKVETWLMPSRGGNGPKPDPAVIFAHGNAELIDFCLAEFQTFSKLGLQVLFVEFPGYGRSEGSPSQESIRATFLAAYDMLIRRKGVDPARIVLLGRSMGGGAVCQLARERPSAALILISAFTSARSFAKRYLAPAFLVRDPFDNLAAVRSYKGPVLIIHGKYDDIIPYRHGKTLYQAAADGKMISYECGHNDCPPGSDMFWHDIELFLRDAGVIDR